MNFTAPLVAGENQIVSIHEGRPLMLLFVCIVTSRRTLNALNVPAFVVTSSYPSTVFRYE